MYARSSKSFFEQVGTSLELSQRLEDPLPRNNNPTQHYHIFDIERKKDVVKIWQSFAERTRDIYGKDRPSKLEMYKAHLNGLESHARNAIGAVAKRLEQHVSKDSDGPKPDYVEERRKQYFRACDPPQLQGIKRDDASSRLFPDPKHSMFTTSTRETMALPDSTAIASILTQEGKRQVRRILDLFYFLDWSLIRVVGQSCRRKDEGFSTNWEGIVQLGPLRLPEPVGVLQPLEAFDVFGAWPSAVDNRQQPPKTGKSNPKYQT